MVVTRTRISPDYIKSNSHGTTRTRISGDYIRPDTCRERTMNCYGTTRTRVSGDYYRPLVPARYSPVVHHIYPSEPEVILTREDRSNPAVTALALLVLTVGFIALVALVPYCYTEEVCTPLGNGLRQCHLERVCTTLF